MAKFRVRARTVDLLGRQQIANISTALSELFKNAHDAYAQNVGVDYFRDDGLLVLRDDGLGMTREDFEQRWLTLGTDSKVGAKAGLDKPPVDPGQDSRPILGEKGIGRLAIAVIGNQILVLTRAKRDGKAAKTLTAAYLHWGLFELPGIDLDDITIPVAEFPADILPNEDDVLQLVNQAKAVLDDLKDRVDVKTSKALRREMDAFRVDPADATTYLGVPNFDDDGCGTHFYILPADKIIQDDIDTREAKDKATRFEKNLIGFTNTMTPRAKRPLIITRFLDHVDEGKAIERVGEKTFFTPEEFDEVDHHIHGRFDEFGQFKGQIGVYHMEPDDYVLNWDMSDGKPTLCGPFSFSIAVLQGAARDSLVDPLEYSRMKNKLDRYGGLYIYKDGIRVQPYGDSGYDFLDIERRRTLSASYYYYSFRRMFGAVELNGTDNWRLKEKAGREGFREDTAYRQFRSILMNFFIQSAADYFRVEGKYSEPWEITRDKNNRNAEVREKKAKQATTKKRELQKNLTLFFEAMDIKAPEEKAEQALSDLEEQVSKITTSNIPPTEKASALLVVEKEGRDVIREIQKQYTVVKPRGFGMSRALTNEWLAYQKEASRLREEVLQPAEVRIEASISNLAMEHSLDLDAAARLDAVVRERTMDAVRTVKSLRAGTEGMLAEVAKKVRETTKESFKNINKTVDEVLVDLEHLKGKTLSSDAVSSARKELEDRIGSVFETERTKLTRLKDQLISVHGFWQEDGFDTAELTEALEEELEELRESRDADLELAQIGLVVNTINHEFEKTIGVMRDGFRRMKSWADANPKLGKLYNDMRYSFDHLDGYLSLFTPLDRRLHRKAVDISGQNVFDFLTGLFEVRLKRHDTELKATEKFKKAFVHGYPSSFFPIYVNLVDNAIFWQERNQDRKREIVLDVDGTDFLVRDNGPGVSVRDRENIFRLNFSRKPGGRGMGLYISRESLAKIGYGLTLDPRESDSGAIFRLSPKEKI